MYRLNLRRSCVGGLLRFDQPAPPPHEIWNLELDDMGGANNTIVVFNYRPFPDLRESNASTLRTSDWEIPNCLSMREGAIPALKVASTAFT